MADTPGRPGWIQFPARQWGIDARASEAFRRVRAGFPDGADLDAKPPM
jgi:hypothetical protein